MSEFDQLVERASAQINPERLEKLLMDLIDTPGPTGFEKDRAEHICRYMANDGLDTVLQEFSEGRANGIGILRGSGGGPTLQYNGHLDTSFSGDEAHDFPATGPLPPGLKSKAFVQDDWIGGLGAYNMLGGVAAQTEAACAIKRAGIQLRGDLVVAGVAGEIESTQVDGLFRQYRGPKYEGMGIGTRYLWTHGYVADFAIMTEPSGMQHVRRFKSGLLYLRLITRGRLGYGGARGVRYPENALLKMARLVQAVEDEFVPAYAARHTLEYELGDDDERPVPTATITAIESGFPYKPSTIPAICYAYMEMRMAPREFPLEAVAELKQFLGEFQQKHGIAVEVQPLANKPVVFVTHPDSYVVQAAKRACQYVSGLPPTPRTDIQAGSDDTGLTLQFGCPSIAWGPSSQADRASGPDISGEALKKGHLLEAAKMFVVATLDICLKERSEIVATAKRKFEEMRTGQVI